MTVTPWTHAVPSVATGLFDEDPSDSDLSYYSESEGLDSDNEMLEEEGYVEMELFFQYVHELGEVGAVELEAEEVLHEGPMELEVGAEDVQAEVNAAEGGDDEVMLIRMQCPYCGKQISFCWIDFLMIR
jgi:hypothetical protein